MAQMRAHKLANTMEFNPVIPPRATQTYSMRKKCKNNLQSLRNSNFNSALTVHVNRQLTLTLFRNVNTTIVQQRWPIVPAIYIMRVSFQGDVMANIPCLWSPVGATCVCVYFLFLWRDSCFYPLQWRDFFYFEETFYYLARLFFIQRDFFSFRATFFVLGATFLFGATFFIWRDFFSLARLFFIWRNFFYSARVFLFGTTFLL